MPSSSGNNRTRECVSAERTANNHRECERSTSAEFHGEQQAKPLGVRVTAVLDRRRRGPSRLYPLENLLVRLRRGSALNARDWPLLRRYGRPPPRSGAALSLTAVSAAYHSPPFAKCAVNASKTSSTRVRAVRMTDAMAPGHLSMFSGCTKSSATLSRSSACVRQTSSSVIGRVIARTPTPVAVFEYVDNPDDEALPGLR